MELNVVDKNLFFVEVAERFKSIANKAIDEKGHFTVALSGGSTPKNLYDVLLEDKYQTVIDWEKIYFFFGDERDVSPMSEKSNYRMANEFLLKPLNISDANVFRWQTEITNSNEVAENYERSIKKFFDLHNNEFPKFDLIFLGMGDDGHTASLFPFTKALSEQEMIVVSNYVEKLDTNRLTFTFPTINKAKNIIFLVTGENKGETLKKVLEGEKNCEKFPSQCVNPTNGNLLWFVDESAAKLLSN